MKKIIHTGLVFTFLFVACAHAADFVMGMFEISNGSELSKVQAFKSSDTKLQLTRVAMHQYPEFKNVYNLRLKIKRLDSNLELKNIEYVVKFYNGYGEEIKATFVNTIESAKFADQDPGFFADESMPTWEGEHNLELKDKPATLKVWIKRYMTKDGKVKNFK